MTRRMREVQDAKLGRDLVALLSDVAGDSGEDEGAVECCKRILKERAELKDLARAVLDSADDDPECHALVQALNRLKKAKALRK